MANNNNLFGFLPIGREGGGPWSCREYAKAAAHTQALFRGDIVSKSAISVVSPFAGAPVPGVTSLQNGTPGTTLWLGANMNYGAPATATLHYIVDDPFTMFIGQSTDATALTVAAAAGKNALLATGAGNATIKQSTMGFVGATIATTAGFDLRLERLFNRTNNAEGAYAIFEVTIMKHATTQGSAGV
jgi:hypothetical protein